MTYSLTPVYFAYLRGGSICLPPLLLSLILVVLRGEEGLDFIKFSVYLLI